VPEVVVLLTDGATTQGVDPLVAAQQAAARGVRVSTIGFGTTEPAGASCSAAQLGAGALDGGFGGFGDPGGGFGFQDPGGGGGFGGGFGGARRFLEIDEPTLQAVASTTGGTYVRAEDAGQLQAAFRDLPRTFAVQHQRHELSAWFALGGAALALAAVALSWSLQRT
jgi:Ca-activated chloride channel family protein